MRQGVRSACPILLAVCVAACSDGGPSHGKVVGDAYLALELGEEVNLTSYPIHLVDYTEELDSALARICVRRDAELDGLKRRAGSPPAPAGPGAAPGDTATFGRMRAIADWAWTERDRILRASTRRTVVTDAHARFAIDSVQPGEYRLWADTTVRGDHWTWLQPLRIRAGDSTRVNLSNANIDTNPFKCRS